MAKSSLYWLGNWAPVSGWAIGIGIEVDALSLFFGLIVTVAVFASCIYAFTYMAHDDSQANYFSLFLMLSGSVLGLVLSGDLFNIFGHDRDHDLLRRGADRIPEQL